jgi:hypothetical protein
MVCDWDDVRERRLEVAALRGAAANRRAGEQGLAVLGDGAA